MTPILQQPLKTILSTSFLSWVPMAPSVLEALNDTMKVGVVHGAQRFSFRAHLVLGKSRTTFSRLFDFVKNRSLKKIDRP